MEHETIEVHMRVFEPMTVGLEVDAFCLPSAEPGEHEIIAISFLVKAGERTLATCRYPFVAGQALLKSPIFDDPLLMMLRAHKSPGRDDGLLYVALAGAPTTPAQEAAMDALDASRPEGLGLWDVHEHGKALPLGAHWMPAGPEVLRPIRLDSETLTEDLREFDDRCLPFFQRVLFGNPTEEVERLIASVAASGGAQ